MSIEQLLEEFKKKRILVVGDVMIDAYILGKVNRISPEAPVPIVSLSKEEYRLGGAANVALNLKSMGATPILCSVIGADNDGDKLSQLLHEQGMSTKGICSSISRKTTVKTRIIGNQQQLVRIDSEDTHPINKNEERDLIETVIELLKKDTIDAVIFEDYNKGILTPKVIQSIIEAAKGLNIPTTVDPKKDNFLAYKGVTLFKPNLKELTEGVGIACEFKTTHLFNEAIQRLENELNNEITFVTLSENGVYIKKGEETHHIKAHIRNIADVSGAGDTVISIATLCLTAGCPIEQVAELSNLAGGLVCEKSGVVSIEPDQLQSEYAIKQF